MNKIPVVEIKDLTILEVLADLQCYALGSFECDDEQVSKRRANKSFDSIQEEVKILKDFILNSEKEHNELKAYKDLEKETGVSFSIVLEALKKGIYTNGYPEHMKVPTLRIVEGEWCFVKAGTEVPRIFNFKLKDYKKTWALKREDLK